MWSVLKSVMECRLCGHPKAHKHSRTSKGSQRYRCPQCGQTFRETFDTLFYRRRVSEETIRMILQAPAEGSSL
jgi:transposase-like protein